MSYEHKETAKNALSMVSSLVGIPREETKIGLEELDHVYAQAAKASEYEAKAKAFDRIVEQRKETGVKTLGHYALEIIRDYESGESND